MYGRVMGRGRRVRADKWQVRETKGRGGKGGGGGKGRDMRAENKGIPNEETKLTTKKKIKWKKKINNNNRKQNNKQAQWSADRSMVSSSSSLIQRTRSMRLSMRRQQSSYSTSTRVMMSLRRGGRCHEGRVSRDRPHRTGGTTAHSSQPTTHNPQLTAHRPQTTANDKSEKGKKKG